MKEYQRPETRIKRVKDERGERFYAQYKLVVIHLLLWEWTDILIEIHNPHHVSTREEAECRINDFLVRDQERWEKDQARKERKKVKKEIEYMIYPDEG